MVITTCSAALSPFFSRWLLCLASFRGAFSPIIPIHLHQTRGSRAGVTIPCLRSQGWLVAAWTRTRSSNFWLVFKVVKRNGKAKIDRKQEGAKKQRLQLWPKSYLAVWPWTSPRLSEFVSSHLHFKAVVLDELSLLSQSIRNRWLGRDSAFAAGWVIGLAFPPRLLWPSPPAQKAFLHTD